MTFGEEKSFEEIAQILGISKEEAMNIYENALGKIRRDPERMNALEELLKEATKQADASES